jgi:hypothetical protein
MFLETNTPLFRGGDLMIGFFYSKTANALLVHPALITGLLCKGGHTFAQACYDKHAEQRYHRYNQDALALGRVLDGDATNTCDSFDRSINALLADQKFSGRYTLGGKNLLTDPERFYQSLCDWADRLHQKNQNMKKGYIPFAMPPAQKKRKS